MPVFFGKPLHSILLPHRKATMDRPVQSMPVPPQVVIAMQQHIGPPAKPLVAKGDEVQVGQLIGDNDAPLGVPMHSSVSGTVVEIGSLLLPKGQLCETIVIDTDEKQTVHRSVVPPAINSFESFIAAVRASGMVGLGGAGFPTYVKYSPKNLSEVKLLLLNGAECEPYITSDYRTMMEQGMDILDGLEVILKYLDIPQCIIGVERNKPEAIYRLGELIKEKHMTDAVSVVPLPNTYPQGAEKVLIYQLTGKIMPEGGLPADIGVLVSNVATVAELGVYFRTGMPLVSRPMTVDGNAITRPKNVLVSVGTPVNNVIAFCGGYKKDPRKILMGGPMMGITLREETFPILKNNNAILAFSTSFAPRYKESSCIHCGKCIRSCPMNLMPTQLKEAFDRRDNEALRELSVGLCIECGNCSYVCPARLELVEAFRLGKARLRKGKA